MLMHKATRQPVIFIVTGLDNLTSWFRITRLFELVKSFPIMKKSHNYPATAIWIWHLVYFAMI